MRASVCPAPKCIWDLSEGIGSFGLSGSFTSTNRWMAGIRIVVTRVGHTHVAQAKAAPESALDDCAVLRPHKIEQYILRRGLALRIGGAGKQRQRQQDRAGNVEAQPGASAPQTSSMKVHASGTEQADG